MIIEIILNFNEEKEEIKIIKMKIKKHKNMK